MLESEPLACSDISLWEIGMLIAKGRVTVAAETEQFLEDIIHARDIQVLPITPRIAALAQSQDFLQADPADRIIAATAIAHRAKLLSADDLLRRLTSVEVVW
jgi:PIN domain nuclease of toxin-antitoxin system